MSEFNYKQRPSTPEWQSNYDRVFGKKPDDDEKRINVRTKLVAHQRPPNKYTGGANP